MSVMRYCKNVEPFEIMADETVARQLYLIPQIYKNANRYVSARRLLRPLENKYYLVNAHKRLYKVFGWFEEI